MLFKVLKFSALVAVLVIAVGVDAYAQTPSNSVFTTIIDKGVALFKEVRTVVFVLGGFGLVGLAVASIFGRPMWRWFALLALGLVVVAVANAIVNYFTTKDGANSNDKRLDFKDTLTSTGTV